MNHWKNRAEQRKVYDHLLRCRICLIDDSDPNSFSISNTLPFSLEIKFVFDTSFSFNGFRMYDPQGILLKTEYFPHGQFKADSGEVTISTKTLIINDMWSVEELYEEFSS